MTDGTPESNSTADFMNTRIFGGAMKAMKMAHPRPSGNAITIAPIVTNIVPRMIGAAPKLGLVASGNHFNPNKKSATLVCWYKGYAWRIKNTITRKTTIIATNDAKKRNPCIVSSFLLEFLSRVLKEMKFGDNNVKIFVAYEIKNQEISFFLVQEKFISTNF